jgi:hypothetical protein
MVGILSRLFYYYSQYNKQSCRKIPAIFTLIQKCQSRGIGIIVIIIIALGLGGKGIKYVVGNFSEEQQSDDSRGLKNPESPKPNSPASFGWIAPKASLSDYRLIIENDLLKPLGWQKIKELPPAPPEPVVQKEEPRERSKPPNEMVLTGIVYLEEERVALMEDISLGEAYFLKEGDKIKDYLVESIAEEDIVLARLDNEDIKITTALGAKAQYGQDGSVLLPERRYEQQTEYPIESPDKDNSANLSLIEQMKARRRRELERE